MNVAEEVTWILAALGTACSFALSSMIAVDAARSLGAMKFSLGRAAVSLACLLALSFWAGDWDRIRADDLLALALSGVLGVLVSDALRYGALARLGPRRAAVVNSAGVPFTLILGLVALGEHYTVVAFVGSVVVYLGIVIAIRSRVESASGKAGQAGDEEGGLAVSVGLAMGLGAALAQAVAIIVAKPVMASGADPMAASVVRTFAGLVILSGPVLWEARMRPAQPTPRRIVLQVVASGIIGTAVGMTLQLFALSHGPSGVVAALTAMTPVVILPMLWVWTRRRPRASSWLGATIAVAGVAMMTLWN
jgi:drug/metabolite transporter (DMT)-like permease